MNRQPVVALYLGDKVTIR